MGHYAGGKNAVTGSSGNVAAAIASASLAATPGVVNYISGFSVRGAGADCGSSGSGDSHRCGWWHVDLHPRRRRRSHGAQCHRWMSSSILRFPQARPTRPSPYPARRSGPATPTIASTCTATRADERVRGLILIWRGWVASPETGLADAG